jgi:hypothetical protein
MTSKLPENAKLCPPEYLDTAMSFVPPSASRVQVQTREGRIAYRAPDQIEDSDTLVLDGRDMPIVMMREPGRTPTGNMKPPELHSKVLRKEAHLQASELVQATSANPESDDVFVILMRDLAKELTRLEFLIQELDAKNGDTSYLSNLRIRSLRQMADLWIKKREKTDSGVVDMKSPSFQILFAFILETFKDALRDAGTRPEHIETVFSKLSKRLEDGWEEDARNKMKDAVS